MMTCNNKSQNTRLMYKPTNFATGIFIYPFLFSPGNAASVQNSKKINISTFVNFFFQSVIFLSEELFSKISLLMSIQSPSNDTQYNIKTIKKQKGHRPFSYV